MTEREYYVFLIPGGIRHNDALFVSSRLIVTIAHINALFIGHEVSSGDCRLVLHESRTVFAVVDLRVIAEILPSRIERIVSGVDVHRLTRGVDLAA